MLDRYSTVDERAKKNGGFLTGRNHKLNRETALANGVNATSQSPAPNYRESEPGTGACMDCKHFAGDQTCTKYDFKASPQMVSDGFEPKGAPAAPPMGAEEGGMIG